MARTFGVSRKSIRDWRNNKPSLKLNVANGRKYGRHCSFKVEINHYPEMEILLGAWIMDARNEGLAVTRKMIASKAVTLLESLMVPHATFKASATWISRFMKRQQLSLRTISTLNQHNPVDISSKIIWFILYTRKVLEDNSGLKVWAADETPVFFDLFGNKTVNKSGNVEVKLKTSGGEKKMVTCLPVASSDGTKNPLL